MSKRLEYRECGECAKKYLFGGAYEETVCPGCLPARMGFVRTEKQRDELFAAWRTHCGRAKRGQEEEAVLA
jgi:hypothetical protein